MNISKKFRAAIKLQETPITKLAWQIGSTPGQLYHLLNHHQHIYSGDERLLKLADRLSFPRGDIFEERD